MPLARAIAFLLHLGDRSIIKLEPERFSRVAKELSDEDRKVLVPVKICEMIGHDATFIKH